MNGRIYDPRLGRFLSVDPVFDNLGMTQGVNAYSYVRNNPVSYTDPSGLATMDQVDVTASRIQPTPWYKNLIFWGSGSTGAGVAANEPQSNQTTKNQSFVNGGQVAADVRSGAAHSTEPSTPEGSLREAVSSESDLEMLDRMGTGAWGIHRVRTPAQVQADNAAIGAALVTGAVVAAELAPWGRIASWAMRPIHWARGWKIFGKAESVVPAGQKLLTYTGKLADHHVMPRQFEKFFKARGINIDDFTVSVDHTVTHLKGIHGTGNMGQMPGRWNQIWGNWIRLNPNATATEIYQQAGKMMNEFGIGDLKIHPYGK